MPLIMWGTLLGFPLKRQNRIPFLDWHETFFALAETKGWRVFYVGGKQSSIDKGKEILKASHPNLSIRYHNGYLTDSDLPALYDEIRAFQPNVLLVGMGMPIQERWILNAFEHVRANIIVNGGAMIEYITRDQLPPPRWLGRFGMEWSYRLFNEPRRLAYRYLVEPFFLVDLFFKDIMARILPRT
jgi:N-acetylglucosaminyldiphosphoundecaprenol N-acetyl-beta-D-mannosaminyltransferase